MKNLAVFFLTMSGIIGSYSLMKSRTFVIDTGLRMPASVPANYESMSACEKQEALWEKALATVYKELPPYKKLGLPELIGMGHQGIATKGMLISDFAPENWVKYLHRHGSLAKVKIVAVSDKYAGVFRGAECALLRLSLTYKVTRSKPVAPGLALKILKDGSPSQNVSALVSLNGQEKDYNFFKNPMSNIVPPGDGIGQALVHRLFRTVTHYPEELVIDSMAARQVFFVPAKNLKSSSEKHDVREDFMAIPEGTKIYELRAVPEKYADLDYGTYTAAMAETFVKESVHIADIITTSEFISSSFGDDGIFFKHHIRD
ncbi:MAG: hypothetical protein ACJ76H_12215 [Bacteriovoracaceae bacterium]